MHFILKETYFKNFYKQIQIEYFTFYWPYYFVIFPLYTA